MARTVPALTLLLLSACAHQPPPRVVGDVHEGPCRIDADCPPGEHCRASRVHLWSSSGIVGDHVTHRCEAPALAPTNAPTSD